MNFTSFTVPVQQRCMEIYRSAARRYLVFSSYKVNRTPMYKEIENLGSFLLYCLYLDHVTSRKCTDGTGYYLAPGSRLRIPLFRKVSVPNEPWTDDDDEEIGQIAMFIIERKPFERIGGLVHCAETFLGYFMESSITSECLINRCRLLNRHLVRFEVAEYVQCVSQGCWSQFNEQNGDAHILEIRYNNISDAEIETRHEGTVFSPLLVLNRRAIVEAKESEHLKIWKLICAIFLTAVQFEPGREAYYGLRLIGSASPCEILLEIGPHAEVYPNLLEVFNCLCKDPYIELMNLDDIRYLRHGSATHTTNLSPSPELEISSISTPITHADPQKAGLLSRVFCRTIPRSRFYKPNLKFTAEEINQLNNSTDYRKILPVVEEGFLVAHESEKGFLLRLVNRARNNHVAAAKRRPSPIHLGSADTIPLTYLALDDIEIPPLFLRNSQKRPTDEMNEMNEEACQILRKRWEFISLGKGEDSTDRNERFVDVTHEVHEFL